MSVWPTSPPRHARTCSTRSPRRPIASARRSLRSAAPTSSSTSRAADRLEEELFARCSSPTAARAARTRASPSATACRCAPSSPPLRGIRRRASRASSSPRPSALREADGTLATLQDSMLPGRGRRRRAARRARRRARADRRRCPRGRGDSSASSAGKKSGAAVANTVMAALAITTDVPRRYGQVGMQVITDESQAWLRELRDPATREAAATRLHGLLLRAARFEVARRRRSLAHVPPGDVDDLAMQAADDALISILAKLDTFRGAQPVHHLGVQVRAAGGSGEGAPARLAGPRGQDRRRRSGRALRPATRASATSSRPASCSQRSRRRCRAA